MNSVMKFCSNPTALYMEWCVSELGVEKESKNVSGHTGFRKYCTNEEAKNTDTGEAGSAGYLLGQQQRDYRCDWVRGAWTTYWCL